MILSLHPMGQNVAIIYVNISLLVICVLNYESFVEIRREDIARDVFSNNEITKSGSSKVRTICLVL